MVGPGTGIAPFRAFLEERSARGQGKELALLRRPARAFDFLDRDEMEEGYRQSGCLTRLDLAFSRDQKEKIYVQHRMKENAREIWKWLQVGCISTSAATPAHGPRRRPRRSMRSWPNRGTCRPKRPTSMSSP